MATHHTALSPDLSLHQVYLPQPLSLMTSKKFLFEPWTTGSFTSSCKPQSNIQMRVATMQQLNACNKTLAQYFSKPCKAHLYLAPTMQMDRHRCSSKVHAQKPWLRCCPHSQTIPPHLHFGLVSVSASASM